MSTNFDLLFFLSLESKQIKFFVAVIIVAGIDYIYIYI